MIPGINITERITISKNMQVIEAAAFLYFFITIIPVDIRPTAVAIYRAPSLPRYCIINKAAMAPAADPILLKK